MHCDQFWPFSKTCHFSNIRCFLKPFFAQNNSNVLLESFFHMFFRILIFDPNWAFCKAIAMHCDQFWPFSKTCHFSNIRCFLEPFFAQNNSNVLVESFFMFFRILIFDPNWAFCKGYSPCIVTNFGHFRKLVIFRILGVFWSRFLHRTTLMCF